MKCKNCGQELDKKAVVCTGCGCKIKKPFFKKWWFWVVIVIVVAAALSSGSDSNKTATTTTENKAPQKEEQIVYEKADLKTMFDALEANAMKAEKDYQNKHIEFECRIKNFDSDGKYIGVEPVNASEWNFTTAMCYIKNDAHRDFLIEKSAGDTITIKGKVNSIGEVLGYSIDIAEVY